MIYCFIINLMKIFYPLFCQNSDISQIFHLKATLKTLKLEYIIKIHYYGRNSICNYYK